MATIYIDVPGYAPDTIVVDQAETIDGTRTEVVNALYTSFPIAGNFVVISDPLINNQQFSFVRYTVGAEVSDELVIQPLGDITQTLQEIFDKVVIRMNNEPPLQDFITTTQHVVDSIDKRLQVLQSDLIKYDMTKDFAVDEYQANLPYGFLGVDGTPYFSTATIVKRILTPLPDCKRGSYTDTGIPEHYDIRNGSINVYPSCSEAVTLKYTAYKKHNISKLTDNIPYQGLFNDTITELVVKFGSNPANVVDGVIDAIVYRAVDRMAVRRAPKNVYFRGLARSTENNTGRYR